MTPDQRRQCWSQWAKEHSEDQPPEQVAYAEMRLQQLALDASTRPLPNQAPVPRAAYEHEYPRSPPAEYPTSGCDPLCNDHWARCNSYCDMKDKSCLAACEGEFRICIQGCP
ncbi:MAG: hypothetical protein WBM46_18620 [Polyangiales bacterium]